MKLKAALEAYLAYLKENGKTERTLYTYGKDTAQILAFWGDTPLSELTPCRIGKFLKSEELLALPDGRARAPQTVNKTKGVLKRFILWAIDTQLIENNPLPKALLNTQAEQPHNSSLG